MLKHSTPAEATDAGLGGGVLTTADIIFMVMAAAAPMAVTVALMPLAFAFGNGAGMPGTYLGAVGAMLLFAIGFVRIVPYVKNAGAFYAYIAASFGRISGLGAAYVAALSYFALTCSTVGALAFFTEQFFHQVTGRSAHWSLWAFASIGIMAVLSHHRITLAAKVLGFALVAEILAILLLDVGIIRDVGIAGFEFLDFAPRTVLVPGLGIGAIYAFSSMIGVEGTAIYQEEARDPAATVPKATYCSIGMVGLFYVFTAWCLTSSAGSAHVAALARENPGEFIVNRSTVHLGAWGASLISALVLTSSLASALGLFNSATRYLYALARDGVLPHRLAATHPIHHSPHVAGLTLTAGLVFVFVMGVIAHLDPLVNIATALVGVGTVGLMALISVTAFAVPAFFAARGDFGFATTVAPAAGGLIIAIATWLAFANYPALTGVDNPLINHLPYLLLIVACVGIAQALWLRSFRPQVYTRIGSSHVEVK